LEQQGPGGDNNARLPVAVGQADVLRMQLLLERSRVQTSKQLNGERKLAYSKSPPAWGDEVDFAQLEGQLQHCLHCATEALERAIRGSPLFKQTIL